MTIETTYMTELVFVAGLALGIGIGVPTLARLWQVDLPGALKRV